MIVALLVCLIPTTIGGLLSAIGIAGMDRLIRKNVLAMSGRAIEAAGDVDVLLLDKTGTITLGNRMATEFIPVRGGARRGAGRGRAARQPGRRDARRPLDRRADQGEVQPAAAATSREPSAHVRALQRADPHERRAISTAARSARAPWTPVAAHVGTAWAATRPAESRIAAQDRRRGRHAAGGRRRQRACSA